MKKVALVTGASAGLGAEFARQLSERGYRLVLAARRKDRIEELARELGKARAVAIDLSKANAAAKLIADLEEKGEVVDLLVNNAGFLDGQYTVWGQVESGMEYVDALPVGEPPREPGKIIKATVS